MDFGAENAGVQIVFANDIDHDACRTYRKYFKNADVIEGDIRGIRRFPKVDIVLGGYPCQSFSMGGNRNPDEDERTNLFEEFARCVNKVNPRFFVAENVSGLQKIRNGHFLEQQLNIFKVLGKKGYVLSYKIIDAKEYGVPQSRKRLFIVGVRKDLGMAYEFPLETHGKANRKRPWLKPFASHGEAIKHLPLWPAGEFYERPHDPEGHFSWYYMSRNRKAPWNGPAYTVVANWRHITLHPASPVMKLTWSNLSDGWKQRWDFSDEYEHIESDSTLSVLETPRRLSWRECALIQTFPKRFSPAGKIESKFTQIGNAVPPELAEVIVSGITSGKGLIAVSKTKVKAIEREQFELAI